jgi:uncharacterized protein YecT (DUF1311 family)
LEVSKTKQGVKVENKPDSTLKLHRIYTDFGVYITLGNRKQVSSSKEIKVSGKISTTIMATVIASFLVACGKEPPKCSDDDTFSLVRKIVLDQLGGGEGLTEAEIKENMKIEFPRASAFDEKIKKYSCEAKLIVGGTIQLPITYESQLDDKNQHIVSVGGIRRGDLFALQAGMIEGIKKSRAEKNNVTKPAEVPPTPKPAEQPAPVATLNPAPSPAPVAEKVQPSPQPSWSPSFDCAKASTFSEKAICTDTLLGKLDGALAENYKYMLASDIGDGARNDLKGTQRKWLAERNKCTENQCLASAYRKRIDEVCEYPVISGVHPVCTNSDEVK